VSSQRAVGELLVEFRDRGFVKSMIVITHDLAILYQVADTILVMYAGKLAEKAPARPSSPHRVIRTHASSSRRSRRLASASTRRGWPGSRQATVIARAAGRLQVPRPLPARIREMRGGTALRRGRARPRGRVLEGRRLMLALDGVSKVYKVGTFGAKRLRAVNDVSFQVAPGEVVSLIGESGSGKSTIGRMVLGLSRATEGTIRFDGPGRLAPREGQPLVLRRRAGRLPGSVQLVQPDLQGRPGAHAAPQAYFSGHRPREWHAKLERVARGRRLEPGDVLDKYPHQLSGGQLQRMLIARRSCSTSAARRRRDHQHARRLDPDRRAEPARRPEDARLGILFITHDLSLGNYISRPHDDPARGEWSRWARPSVSSGTRSTRTRGRSCVGAAAAHEVEDVEADAVGADERRGPRRHARRGRARPLRRTGRDEAERRVTQLAGRRGDAAAASRGRTARRVERRRLALEPQPDRPARPRPAGEQHLQLRVVPFGDGFAGVFRVDDTRRADEPPRGRSADGIDWEIDAEPIAFAPRTSASPRPERSSTPTTRA
jgi:peptide/nickel transport system ATP-binding protein